MITKGKWYFSTGDPDLKNFGVYSNEGGRIAEILNQNADNARLIAAAPETLKQRDDLLKACKKREGALWDEMRALTECLPGQSEPLSDIDQAKYIKLHSEWTETKAAIANATEER